MLEYDWIDVLEGIDVIKSKESLGILLAIIIALLKRSERSFKGLAISKLILC